MDTVILRDGRLIQGDVTFECFNYVTIWVKGQTGRGDTELNIVTRKIDRIEKAVR